MPKIYSPHDAIFKTAMADKRVAKEFFNRHLPSHIRNLLDINSLVMCPQTYTNEALEQQHIDVLYKAKIKEKDDDVYLYLLCEHQSTPDILMSFRLLKYNVSIWDDHLKHSKNKKLPLIINTVFYNGKREYKVSRDLKDLLTAPKEMIDEFFLQSYILIDVQSISDEELRNHNWSGIVEFFMKNASERDFLPYLKKALQHLQWLRLNDANEYAQSLLNYTVTVSNTENIKVLVEMIKNELQNFGEEKMGTIAEQLKQLGRQEGMQQGMQQGARAIFLMLLKIKFPEINESEVVIPKDVNSELLRCWSKRLLNAKAIDDIFKDDLLN